MLNIHTKVNLVMWSTNALQIIIDANNNNDNDNNNNNTVEKDDIKYDKDATTNDDEVYLESNEDDEVGQVETEDLATGRCSGDNLKSSGQQWGCLLLGCGEGYNRKTQ